VVDSQVVAGLLRVLVLLYRFTLPSRAKVVVNATDVTRTALCGSMTWHFSTAAKISASNYEPGSRDSERVKLNARHARVRDRGVYFIASLIRLVCALKRTAASVRLRVRSLTVLRPASVRRILTSLRVQGWRLSMGAFGVLRSADSIQQAVVMLDQLVGPSRDKNA
jgi:hypothetical protein